MRSKYGTIYGKNDQKINRLIHGAIMVDINEQQRSMDLLDSLVEVGCTTFDTATVYRDGRCEQSLGAWMETRNNRDKIFIISKCGHWNEYRRRVTPYDIGADLLDSLIKLRTDYIDMYMLHRDDPTYPVGALVEAFNNHIEEGRINFWGVSNWTYDRVKAANEYAKKHNLIPCSAVSSHYSLAKEFAKPWGGSPFGDEGVTETITGSEMKDARKWFEKTQIPFFAWSPLGRGLFTGNFSREAFKNDTTIVDEAAAKAFCHEENFIRLDRVETLAHEKGSSVPRIALAWLLHQPLNIFLLVGVNNVQEYLDDAKAFDIKLTQEEIDWLDLRSDSR